MTDPIKAGLQAAAATASIAASAPAPSEPVLPREEAHLPHELPRGAEIPADLDPLADGVLMAHQRTWLEDKSDLKIAEKGRRTGITFAEALDDTLIAASARSAGGDNVFYIGDTKDKGREFIGYVAHFARVVAKETAEIEEFLFEDQRDDGSSKHISAYRVTFASGYRVEALSSRPENIRGLQGVVVIDEAAYHKDVRAVIDAVMALLIWGGKVRVISSHNGVLNPFNELIRESRTGKNRFKVHFIPFSEGVKNGLFRRVCLMRGRVYSPEAEAEWEATIRGAYGTRTAQMAQELDAIPADATGAALSRVVIEQNVDRAVQVVRYNLPDAFKEAPEALRTQMVAEWCKVMLAPHLTSLDLRRRHDMGWDFARSGDGSDIVISAIEQDLRRRWKLVIELRNVPFESQKQISYFVIPRLPRFGHAAFDGTGNGAYLAEVTRQKFGERISEIKLSVQWYRENGVAYTAAFSEQTVTIAADDDIVRDHQALQFVGGVVKVPDDMRYAGSDGFMRHGDTAIAGMLCWYASRQGAVEYGYEAVTRLEADPWFDPDDEPDGFDMFGGAMRQPLGTRIRGGGV